MRRHRKERQVKDEHFFTIFGWMTSPYRMNLSGIELNVYAVIFGMSQGKGQYFTGSHNYLAEFCGCSEDRVKKVLRSLTDKGYLVKEETGYNAFRYKAKNYNQLLYEENPYIGHEPEDDDEDEKKDGVKTTPDGVKTTSHGVKTTPHGVKTTPDIKSINNNINNIYNARARAIPQKRAPDKSKNQKNNKFMNFDQRDNIDYQLLEEKLLNKSSP